MIFFRRRPEYDWDKEITPQLWFRIWTSGWRGAVVLAMLTTVVLAWWKGPEVYESVKVRRAESLIAQSEAARERGDTVEASKTLGAATALLRRHPVTLRAVARYQIENHDLSALHTYAELLKTGQATTADKTAFVRLSFQLAHPESAAKVLEELESTSGLADTPAVLALKAERSSGEGRWQEAIKFARLACAIPDTAEEDLVYAKTVLGRLLLQPPSPILHDGPDLIAEGISLWSELALRRDAAGLEALHVLVGVSQDPQTASFLNRANFQQLMDAAERHPKSDAALKIAVWNLRLVGAPPEKRAEVAQALFEHVKNHPSSSLRLEAARWLNKSKAPRLALDLAEPAKHESEEWFLVYLDATAVLGNWDEVLRALTAKDQSIPLPPALLRLFELRGALESGRHPDLTAAWRDIQAAARTESVRNQLYIAGYAEQIKFPSEAALIYRRLLDRDELPQPTANKLGRPRRLACYTGLLRTATGSMSLQELGSLVAAFATDFPEIDEVQNDHAYLALLAGTDTGTAALTGERLLKKKPELLAYRTTVALALLKKQQTAAAVAIYDGWDIDWTKAQDRYKAVYAAVMRAGGRIAQAEKIAAGIKPDALRPEERQLAGLP